MKPKQVLGLAAPGIFLVGLAFAVAGVLNNIRYPMVVAGLCYVVASWLGKAPFAAEEIKKILERREFPWLLTFCASLLFARIKWMELNAGLISGEDFSHIDYAIWSTAHGRFMEIPVIAAQSSFLNFFGNHFSPILFIPVLLRMIWDSPLASLLVHAVSLAAAIPALHLLALEYVDRIAASFLVLAYFFCGAVAATLQFDIHQESFYPLALALVFLGLSKNRAWLFAGVALTLAVKEDAGLYLFGIFFVFALVQGRDRVFHLGLGLGCLCATLLALKVLMPMHQPASTQAPYYLPMWSKYGNTFSEIAWGFLSHPHWVAQDVILNKDLYKNLLPWLFMPILSPMGLLAAFPVFVSSTAAGAQRSFGLYYGIVLVPCFFFATAYFLRGKAWQRKGALACFLVAAFVGGSYFHFPQPLPRLETLRKASASVSNLAAGKRIFVQSGLLPFLAYQNTWERLDSMRQIPDLGKAYVALYPGLSQGAMGGDLEKEFQSRGFAPTWRENGLVLLERKSP